MHSKLAFQRIARTSLAIGFMMLCGCSGRTEVDGFMRGGVPVFRIFACGGSEQAVQVRHIRVYRYSDGARSDQPLCSAMPKDSTMGSARMLREWSYGQKLDGWDVQGCDKLLPGVYEVHAYATGVGVSRFELTVDGKLKRLFSLCR